MQYIIPDGYSVDVFNVLSALRTRIQYLLITEIIEFFQFDIFDDWINVFLDSHGLAFWGFYIGDLFVLCEY